MAVRYYYSGAGGSGAGADWTNAHATLAAANTASSAGDTYYLAQDSAESVGSSTTWTFKGTTAAPDKVIGVNRAGSVPPVAGDERTTGALLMTANTFYTINGSAKFTGLSISLGSGSASPILSLNQSSGGQQFYEACTFTYNTTGGPTLSVGSSGQRSRTELLNCLFAFGSSAGTIQLGGGNVVIRNTNGAALVSGSFPTPLFNISGSGASAIELRGLDLSNVGSGKTLFSVTSLNPTVKVVGCKLHASVTITAAPAGYTAGTIDLIGCDSGGVVARNERYHYSGTLTTETTIKRTGGATDGTTAYSWKLVSTANAKRDFPFETFERGIWNDVVGVSKTLTVHFVTDNVTLKDDEVWLEVEYLSSSGAPISSGISDGPATALTVGVNQATSTETWTTTGLTTPVKQKAEVTFTPQMAGLIRWRLKIGKASATVYVCPKADLV